VTKTHRDLVVSVVIVAATFVYIARSLRPEFRRLNAQRRLSIGYHRLRLGMVRDEVLQAMGRKPDCVVTAPNATVLYFARVPEEILDSKACKGASPGAVARWEDLPVIYAAVEVALDPSGRSVIHGFCAEGGTTSVKGRPAPCLAFVEPGGRP